MDNLIYLGHVAVFYVPLNKLDKPVEGGIPRQMFHDFFMANYDAYTHEKSQIQGFWRDRAGQIDHDFHERYEVSFKGEQLVKEFVAFLSKMCKLLDEDCIYLTMGYKSWLVKPA